MSIKKGCESRRFPGLDIDWVISIEWLRARSLRPCRYAYRHSAAPWCPLGLCCGCAALEAAATAPPWRSDALVWSLRARRYAPASCHPEATLQPRCCYLPLPAAPRPASHAGPLITRGRSAHIDFGGWGASNLLPTSRAGTRPSSYSKKKPLNFRGPKNPEPPCA